jgi:hypothetical protein
MATQSDFFVALSGIADGNLLLNDGQLRFLLVRDLQRPRR